MAIHQSPSNLRTLCTFLTSRCYAPVVPAFAALLLIAGCSRAPSPQDEPAGELHEALSASATRTYGFESLADWMAIYSSPTLALSNSRVEGQKALSVAGGGWSSFISRTLPSEGVAPATVGFDLMIPVTQPNPGWLGTVQLFADIPSRGICSQPLGLLDLKGWLPGQWRRAEFKVPPTLQPALGKSYSDLRWRIELNRPKDATGGYLFDRFTLGPPCSPISDNNPCTNDTCDASGQQQHTPVAAGTSCSNGNACDGAEACDGKGVCKAGTSIACAAVDQCHGAGTCDPGTGVCSKPIVPDGTACTDGSLCTKADSCLAGACVGASPVVCTTTDQCRDPGACDPGTGLCSNPAKADGTACTDGDACTQADTCRGGACTAGSPIVCAAQDQCHLVGACEPKTGVCSNPPKPDGSDCSDANACTLGDACRSGSCVSASTVSCAATDVCHLAGLCDPETGACSDPAAPDGTPCSDDDACTRPDACQGGACQPGAPVSCLPQDACHAEGSCSPLTGACTKPLAFDGVNCEEAPDGRPMRPGSAVLMFRPATPRELQHAVVAASPATAPDAPSGLDDPWEVRFSASNIDAVLAYFNQVDCVQSIEPNYYVFSHLTPPDPYFGQQWNLQSIRVPQAWDYSIASPAVTVAILDTGVFGDDASFDGPDGLPGHPDLRGRLQLPSIDLYPESPDGHDDFFGEGHGTLMAGITSALSGNDVGIAGTAYAASLLNVRVLQADGSGYSKAFADGILKATERGAKVINMSFGAPGPCPNFVQAAVDRAWSAGAVLVAAAGDITGTLLGGSVDYPANCQNVISVTASDRLSGLVPGAPSVIFDVDLAAPGTSDIFSTDSRGKISLLGGPGTSQAAAHVSGVAALVWAAGAKNNWDVVDHLFSSGRTNVPVATYARYGLVDAMAAVTFPGSTPRGNTPIPISPYEGQTVEAIPEFQWAEVIGATDYQFFIYDPFKNLRYTVQYPTGAPCAGGICRMKSPYGALYNGFWSWAVEARMPTLYTFRSSQVAFKVGASVSIGVGVVGGGSVHGANGAFTCSTSACGFPLLIGGALELVADDVAGRPFLGWSGDCSLVSGRSCWVYGNVSKSVTAHYQPPGVPPTGFAISGQRSGLIDRSLAFAMTVGQGAGVVYSWDFGDGATSSGASATHTFAVAGSYVVTGTATNELGEATGTVPVRIEQEPSFRSVHVADGLALIDDDGRLWSLSAKYPGDGTKGPFPSPVLADLPSPVVEVAGGSAHTLALTEDGKLWTWGEGPAVGTGIGTTPCGSNTCLAAAPTPSELNLGPVTSIAAGGYHSIATSAGGAWVWGIGFLTQDPRGIGGTPNWVLSPQRTSIQGVAVGGYNSTAFLNPDGAVRVTGFFGNDGPPDFFNEYSTTPVATPALNGLMAFDPSNYKKSIAFGDDHILAIGKNGEVFAWGRNKYGQLGDGTTAGRFTPVRANIGDVVQVAAGDDCSSALTADGSVWNWGVWAVPSTLTNPSPVQQPGISEVVDIIGCRGPMLRSDGTVWNPGQTPTRAFGVPRPPLPDGAACHMNSDCISKACQLYFDGDDADGDGFAEGTVSSKRCGASPPAGYAPHGGDCCDSDPDAHPGQEDFFETPSSCGSFDYDCSGTAELALTCLWISSTDRYTCGCATFWTDVVPECGEPGWLNIRGGSGNRCLMGVSGTYSQSCR